MFSNRGVFTESGDDPTAPSYIYYNCDIVNNRTDETSLDGTVSPDPQVRFNETRDTALVKDASQYEFSIVRFTMNGPNLDLPLFIPSISVGANNPTNDVNKTNYTCAITFQGSFNVTGGTAGVATFNVAPNSTSLVYVPEIKNTVLAPLPQPPIVQQDIASRYYWIQTYQHWVDLVNQTLLQAQINLWTTFNNNWTDYLPVITSPNPYAGNFTAFQALIQTPQLIYDPTNGFFRIIADSDGYGQRLEPFVSTSPGLATAPQSRLFFNSNMYGLFTNFNNIYWNNTQIPANTINNVLYRPLTGTGLPPIAFGPTLGFPFAQVYPGGVVPSGYVNEIIFTNKYYQNVVDYRLAPYSGTAPLGYVPVANAKVYWELIQDYKSTDSLWSPISSLVFTTTLLPIKSEASSQPNILGTSNTGDSRATSASAFTPIITDVALDTSQGGSSDYRQFIYYAPNAEYRMSALTTSVQEIRNINIAVYWKNRLNNQLYPVNMFNLSSVSLKFMFRHKRIKGKGHFSDMRI